MCEKKDFLFQVSNDGIHTRFCVVSCTVWNDERIQHAVTIQINFEFFGCLAKKLAALNRRKPATTHASHQTPDSYTVHTMVRS